jgi:hypothetical protein
MHGVGIVTFDEIRHVAIAAKQRLQLFVADAREDGRISDLVAGGMQDRQHRAAADRIDVDTAYCPVNPLPVMHAVYASL